MSSCGVPYQCGTIDYVIEQINEALNLTSKVSENLEDDNAISNLEAATSALHLLEEDLESIRSACAELRDYGEDRDKKVAELIEEIEELMV